MQADEKKTGDEKNRPANAKKLKISFNLLWSYLLILLAPVIAIVGIYITARNAMVNTQKERIQNVLSEAELSFDREIKQAQNAGYYVSRERRLYNYLTQNHTGNKEFYSLYELASSYPNYSLTNQVIKDVFIFIADSGYVVKIPQVIPQTEWGKAVLGEFPFYSYESFMEFYSEQDKDQSLFFYENENGEKALLLPCQVGYPYSVPEKSVVVVELDKMQIVQILKPVLYGKEGMVALLDENDTVLISFENTGGEGMKYSRTGMSLEEYLDDCPWGKFGLEVFTKKTNYNGWKLAAVVPRQVMIDRIGAPRHFAVALCVISIFIGIMVCISYWYQRKSMVQEFLRFRIGLRLERRRMEKKPRDSGKTSKNFFMM